MLNYDACIRLMKLHCQRVADAEVASTGARSGASSPSWATVSGSESTGVGASVAATPVVAGGSLAGGCGSGTASALALEKAMKIWLLEQSVFKSRELSR